MSETEGMRTAYVELLDEGVTVYRPVRVRRDGDSYVLIGAQDDAEGERWAVAPGSRVRLNRHLASGGWIDVVVALEE